ncbi:cyclic GMP-AMP synthase-like [Pseudophryne corroboree]|uniref:cyclic GMP-AMP synthase-like n=1 Tax=Pseudophryne corroboree TaxID=495146 RepID=UPI00308201CB
MGDRHQKGGRKDMAKCPKDPKDQKYQTSAHSESSNNVCAAGELKQDNHENYMATAEVYERSVRKKQQKSQKAHPIKADSAHCPDENKLSLGKPLRKETGRSSLRNGDKNTKTSTDKQKIVQHTTDGTQTFNITMSAPPITFLSSTSLESDERDSYHPTVPILVGQSQFVALDRASASPQNVFSCENVGGACAAWDETLSDRGHGKTEKVNERKKSNNLNKKNDELTEHNVRDKKPVNSKSPKRLKDVVERLRMKMTDICHASDTVKKIITKIITSDHLKKDDLFSKIQKFSTGSYYEKLKITKPNEFDIMLEISIPGYQTIELTNVTGAFYTLAYKHRKPKVMTKYLDQDGNISAVQILCQFRKLVSDVFRAREQGLQVHLKKKEPLSPAVTLLIGEEPGIISVDLVLALKLNQPWPDTTRDGMNIDDWLGTKVKQDYKRGPFYMVPKQANLGQENKTDTWRISFSNIEKEIISNHGSQKICCEQRKEMCCRKQCLKLMKNLLELLKNTGNKRKMDQFCSYHAKTALLHMCTKYTKDEDWKLEDLDSCFNRYIEYFQTCLKYYTLHNFFIPSHNLFSSQFIDKASCDHLYKQIEYQKNHSYPLFYPELGCPTVHSKKNSH